MLSVDNMIRRNKLPLILQSEIAECGLVCLAMIFEYHQYTISLTELRRKVKSTMKGVTIEQIKQIAEQACFAVQILRIDMEHIFTLQLPCILHWNLNHFVVLQAVSKKSVVIHDPIKGRRAISFAELSKYFSGIAIELVQTKILQRPKYKKSGIICDIVKKHKINLLKLILISCLIQLVYVGSIHYIEKAIDASTRLLSNQLIGFLLAASLGLKFVEYAAVSVRGLMVAATGAFINYHLGAAIMERLMKLPTTFFENRQVSDILSRFNAIEKIRSTLTEGMVECLVDGVISLIVLAAMCYLNLKITIITILFSIVFFISRIFYYKNNQSSILDYFQARSRELAYFMETLRSMPTIKIFTKESDRLFSWKNKFSAVINANTKLVWSKLFYDFIKNTLFSVEIFFVLVFSCLLLANHTISLGVLYAYLAYRLQFINSIGNLADKIQDYKSVRLQVERLDDILLEPIEENSLQNSCPCQLSCNQTLELRNVSYSYSLNEQDVINDLSIRFKLGECVAITGPSGCGKTTLLKMMLGLLPPSRGEIYIGETDIYSGHVRCYRNKISAVLQTDTLYSGTILDNIIFFDKHPDREHAYYCANLAGILDEINLFPMRFHTLIGEMGSALSGGQKQRLLLARALYSRPNILFLDEATSHLDAIKEREVNQSIRSLGITVIMIAHRKETIAIADRVIQLEKR